MTRGLVATLGFVVLLSTGCSSTPRPESQQTSSSGVAATSTTGSTDASSPTAGNSESGTASSAPPFSHTWEYVENPTGGYHFDVRFEAGDPEHPTPGLRNGSLVAGTGCPIDPQTDAVIPARLLITNTTPGFAAVPFVGLVAPYWAPNRQLQIPDGDFSAEVSFSQGPECTDLSDYRSGAIRITGPKLEPSHAVAVDIIFVLRHYYSPDHPTGDPEKLRAAGVLVPSNDQAITAVTGPGVTDYPDAGSWLIPLSGAASPNPLPDPMVINNS